MAIIPTTFPLSCDHDLPSTGFLTDHLHKDIIELAHPYPQLPLQAWHYTDTKTAGKSLHCDNPALNIKTKIVKWTKRQSKNHSTQSCSTQPSSHQSPQHWPYIPNSVPSGAVICVGAFKHGMTSAKKRAVYDSTLGSAPDPFHLTRESLELGTQSTDKGQPQEGLQEPGQIINLQDDTIPDELEFSAGTNNKWQATTTTVRWHQPTPTRFILPDLPTSQLPSILLQQTSQTTAHPPHITKTCHLQSPNLPELQSIPIPIGFFNHQDRLLHTPCQHKPKHISGMKSHRI